MAPLDIARPSLSVVEIPPNAVRSETIRAVRVIIGRPRPGGTDADVAGRRAAVTAGAASEQAADDHPA